MLRDNGWTHLGPPPYGTDGLHVRVARDPDGRWIITDLYLHGPALTAETLRGVSIPRLEARLNSASANFDPGSADDDDLTVAELRRRARMVSERRRNLRKAGARGALRRPDGSDPEGFYRLVAAAYGEYAQDSRAPAVAIAKEADVPVTTAHRWIREARRRGFLPPGRKGKAG